jgi:oxygen-independent coproporphyrinogen-3 oxidase
VIQRLMCQFLVPFDAFESEFSCAFEMTFSRELSALEGFYQDGILERIPAGIRVTPLGRLFVRNVAMVFDAYLHKQTHHFSKTV